MFKYLEYEIQIIISSIICYRSKIIINVLILSVRGLFHTSESDVYRRQILMYKDGICADGVNFSEYVKNPMLLSHSPLSTGIIPSVGQWNNVLRDTV